jgi:DNA-binding NarL/FixJ family response regulator
MALRVVFAEDNYLVRQGVTSLLTEVEDIDVVAVASDLASLLGSVVEASPDVARNNAMIAKTLFMSDRAVEKQIGSLFQKLGLVDEHEVSRRVMAVLAYLKATGASS